MFREFFRSGATVGDKEVREAQMATTQFQRQNKPDLNSPGVIRMVSDVTTTFLNGMLLKCPIIVLGLLVGASCVDASVSSCVS